MHLIMQVFAICCDFRVFITTSAIGPGSKTKMKKESGQIFAFTLVIVLIMAVLLTISLCTKSTETTTPFRKQPCMMPTYGVGYEHTMTLRQIKEIISEVAACRLESRIYSYQNLHNVHPTVTKKLSQKH